MISLGLIVRFKNERHIMYEFINHYLEEGVDFFLLIDDNSDDDYLEFNKDWMDSLINTNKILIKKSQKTQNGDYNIYFNEVKHLDWLIICDIDEFFFSVPENSTLKSILNEKGNKYDYIRVPWKLFKHESYYQPKSVIEDNIFTHEKEIDPTSSSKGFKCIIKSDVVNSLRVHACRIKKRTRTLLLDNCHNNLIQNNHYRTQSEQFLRGVKEIRGGGVHKFKYKNFSSHKKDIYNFKCDALANKRKNLIEKCLERTQVKPKIYCNSSFYLETNNQIEGE